MMRPSILAKKQKTIDEFVNTLQYGLVRQNFSIANSSIVSIQKNDDLIKSMRLEIEGIANQKLGKTKELKKECSYFVDMKYIEGVLYVEDFGTNCF